MTRGLAFLPAGRPLDFGARLARLRWRRAAFATVEIEADDAPAQTVLRGSGSWVLVRDDAAIPFGPIPEPPSGKIAVGRAAGPAPGVFAHTLRELEGQTLAAAGATAVAVAFRTADFPAGSGETVESLFRRLEQEKDAAGPLFPVYAFDEPSDRERPEVTGRLPTGPLRVLDAGCGAGGLSLARARNPAWEVVGVEKDPVLAARARETCSRVVEGDLVEVLPRLFAEGERFDAVVFADVLEHLEEPIETLARARQLVGDGGWLVVSVPNVGHASVVSDLLLGRFDPVPSGLCDAGHLRWFTHSSLRDAIEEAGWRIETLDGQAGAPAPNADAVARLAAQWPDADRESLATYQWIATARAR